MKRETTVIDRSSCTVMSVEDSCGPLLSLFEGEGGDWANKDVLVFRLLFRKGW